MLIEISNRQICAAKYALSNTDMVNIYFDSAKAFALSKYISTMADTLIGTKRPD
jgi:hypothetical protein